MAKPKKTYHKDNLEAQLLEKAVEIIANKGLAALSLRELGRCTNVSRMAPYHYFADKDALIYKIGQLGFGRLAERIQNEMAGHSEPLDQLKFALFGYLKFALEEPDFFRLMFANVLKRKTQNKAPESKLDSIEFSSDSAASAFEMFVAGIMQLQTHGILKKTDPLLLLNVFWAFAHGVAVLAIDQHLKLKNAEEIYLAGMEALIEANLVKKIVSAKSKTTLKHKNG